MRALRADLLRLCAAVCGPYAASTSYPAVSVCASAAHVGWRVLSGQRWTSTDGQPEPKKPRKKLSPPPNIPDWFVSLNNIRDNPKGNPKKKRWGRGPGGDRGGGRGKGKGGQKARSGRKPGLLFDGGQKFMRQFPKVHVQPTSPFVWTPVYLSKVLAWVKQGRIDPKELITMKDLRDTGCVSKTIPWGVELVTGVVTQLHIPLHLQVSSCTDEARRVVEAAGGSVRTVYYSRLGLRAMLKPEVFAAKGVRLPRALRVVPPKLLGRFDGFGEIPPCRQLPPAPVRPLVAVYPKEETPEQPDDDADGAPQPNAAHVAGMPAEATQPATAQPASR